MGRTIAVGALLLTSCLVSGAADARRARCAAPEELAAVQTAAVQQELMVAALTCNEVSRFNAFQTGFGPELRTADATLLRLFRRLYGGRRGEAAYHAFKTKLANDSEMRSIHNNPAYCQEAGAMLATALTGERPRLTAFVRNLSVTVQQPPARSCMVETAAAAGEVRVVRRHRHRRVVAVR